MAKTISKKSSVKATSENSLGKPPPGDKTLGLETETRFYAIEDGNDTEEGEESEILVVYNSNLAAYNQNLVKSKFPYIDTFDHEVPVVISTMRDLTARVFEHLEITSPIDVENKASLHAAHPQTSCNQKISRGSGDMQAVGEGASGR